MSRKSDSQPSISPIRIATRHPAVICGMPVCYDAYGGIISAKDGIRAIRRWLGWKIEAVAECCGVSTGTVRLWEHYGGQGLAVPAYALLALMLAMEKEEAHRLATRPAEHWQEPKAHKRTSKQWRRKKAVKDKAKSEPTENPA